MTPRLKTTLSTLVIEFFSSILGDSEGDILFFEQLLIEDTFSNLSPALFPKESSLLVTPLPDPEQICLREVERFDPFFSLTQSGGTKRVMETPSFSSHHRPSPRPVAYSPKEVMYCFYHPHHTSGDGFNHESEMVENMDGYRDQDMGDIILGEPFYKASCVEARRFDGLITIHNGSYNVTYQMARTHPRFKHLSNAQCNKIKPLLKVSVHDELNGILHPYQKLKSFYKGALNLGPEYV
ncbi:hypothetical protein Tco_1474056 [Tanacetum coccineum]